MLEDKDLRHEITDNEVRSVLHMAHQLSTDGTIEGELQARALNRHRIMDNIYGREVKELERLLAELYFYVEPFNSDAQGILDRVRQVIHGLLR